jgi:hypothetical protein
LMVFCGGGDFNFKTPRVFAGGDPSFHRILCLQDRRLSARLLCFDPCNRHVWFYDSVTIPRSVRRETQSTLVNCINQLLTSFSIIVI